MTRRLTDIIDQHLKDEVGPPFEPGGPRVCLLYPSPYRAGMSSLGFQWIHEVLVRAGFQVERAFLPDDPEEWARTRTPLLSYETKTPVRSFPVVGASVAYELELAGLVTALDLAGIPPLRRDRDPRHHPRLLGGGPLTFSNPRPLGPFFDAVLMGEAEEAVVEAVTALAEGEAPPRAWSCETEELPPVLKASDELLPARSRTWTPHAELSNMFLMEGERGCHRACTFCVMRRSTNGGMRLVTPERLLSFVPENAPRVGLVGAAISDHPQLVGLLQALVDAGKGIGISSLRADRIALKPDIARLLRVGGYKTLTVASDAASQRLRRTIMKGTTEQHLLDCARIARENRYVSLKVYMMVGVPGEEEADIDELIAFTTELSRITSVTLGVAPFVPKVNTPLVDAGFAGMELVDRHLKRLDRGLKGRAEVRATSARWAWVEAVLAMGGFAEGEAVMRAARAGGRFADYKAAFSQCEAPARLQRASA